MPYFDDDIDSVLTPVAAIGHNVLELLSVLSSSNMLRVCVKLSLFHIINALFHYFILSAEEIETWHTNPLYYVSATEHESIRGKILSVLNDLIEKYQDYAIQGLLIIGEKFLANYSQASTL